MIVNVQIDTAVGLTAEDRDLLVILSDSLPTYEPGATFSGPALVVAAQADTEPETAPAPAKKAAAKAPAKKAAAKKAAAAPPPAEEPETPEEPEADEESPEILKAKALELAQDLLKDGHREKVTNALAKVGAGRVGAVSAERLPEFIELLEA